MKRRIFYLILGLGILIAFNNCSDNKENDINESILSDNELKKQVNVQNFFNTLPPPKDIYEIIQQSNINYTTDYLNDPAKYKNYTLEKPQSLNLGVYGADLAIAAAFNQVQESMLFLKCTNHLAQELGISSAFDESTMNRLELNKENRDSVLKIVSAAFKKADALFSQNKRSNLSILMITGSFVEAMYVAGKYAFAKKEDTIAFKKIQDVYFQQKESLSYLIELLEMSADADDRTLLEKLKNILSLFDQTNNKTDAFIKAHEIFTSIRNEIISVY